MDKKANTAITNSRARVIIFWVATAIITLESATGSVWDVRRISFVGDIIKQLGYPAYLLTIIGIWKAFGAVALVVPRFPRIKEWAYAGLFFIYTGATTSHLVMGQFANALAPLIFAAITVTSWALRPASWRIAPGQLDYKGEDTTRKKLKVAGYWITLIILEFALISGGIGELFPLRGAFQGMVNQLGYPLYFLMMLGVWKILGGISFLVPRFYLLKEWAYAGIFFDLTGVAASWCFMSGFQIVHIIAPLIVASIAVLSWALRPYVR